MQDRSPRDEEDANDDVTRCADCLEGERAGHVGSDPCLDSGGCGM